MQQQVPTFQKVQKIVEVPGVMKRTVQTIQTVQKTVKVPQVQFFDRTEDVPVLTQRQVVPMIQQVKKTFAKFIDRIVNVPVVLHKTDSKP